MLSRRDWTVASAPGVTIAARTVQPEQPTGAPLILVHGGGGGGPASFDIVVPGEDEATTSLAAALARAGHEVHLFDLRGWGGSTRPAAFDQPPAANFPAVRSGRRRPAAASGGSRCWAGPPVAIGPRCTLPSTRRRSVT